MTIEHIQNLVIGSGVAGKIIAWTLAGQGQKTVVVERAMVGGSCPNVACLPSNLEDGARVPRHQHLPGSRAQIPGGSIGK
jgi:pyruvate/2-oxoglutarate dehydrogenase complex dihydrolipoamide dehydrogenase (E3) component